MIQPLVCFILISVATATTLYCPAGMYWEIFIGCVECPAGTYKQGGVNDIGIESCSPCINQTYSLKNSSSCSVCPAGSYTISSTTGGYGGIGCEVCPPGKYRAESGGWGLESCSPCSNDLISQGNASACYPCPAGSMSNANSSGTSCIVCQAGTMSLHGVPCIECDRGYYSAQNSSVCNTCQRGKYPNKVTGATECISCPPGHVTGNISVTETISDCAPCPTGFVPASGSSCAPCPPGSYTNIQGVGASTCFACPLGHIGNASITGMSSRLNCTSCPIGTFSVNSTACIGCPIGQFTNLETDGSWNCGSCPDGFTSQIVNASSRSVCRPCQPGNYSLNSTTCWPCPPGTFCPSFGIGRYNFTPCPTGTYSSTTGAIPHTACIPCGAGNFSLANSTACEPCREGTYAPLSTGSGSCSLCPAGYFRSSRGGDRFSSCSVCPRGTFSTSNSTNCSSCTNGTYATATVAAIGCRTCPAGTYRSDIGGGSLSDCLLCPPGTISANQGSDQCQACPAGYYANLYQGATVCEACPAGSYLNSVGGMSELNCTVCPIGTYSQTASSTCSQCPAGMYTNSDVTWHRTFNGETPQRSGSTGCLACPSGTFNNKTGGATQSTSCFPCPPGQVSTNDKSSCSPCGQGRYGNSPLGSITCNPCQAGTYFNGTGGINVSSCLSCPPGSFSPEGSANCTLCPAGSYANRPFGATGCLACPAGFFTRGVGGVNLTSACVGCPYGMYSHAGNASCSACPAGTYTNVDQQGGAYPSAGATSCLPCPAGTFSATSAARSQEYCIPCDYGYFSDVEKASSCTICPSGSYASSRGQTKCTLCPPGFIFNGTGGDSYLDCVPCPPFTIPNISSQTCVLCDVPHGYLPNILTAGASSCAIRAPPSPPHRSGLTKAWDWVEGATNDVISHASPYVGYAEKYLLNGGQSPNGPSYEHDAIKFYGDATKLVNREIPIRQENGNNQGNNNNAGNNTETDDIYNPTIAVTLETIPNAVCVLFNQCQPAAYVTTAMFPADAASINDTRETCDDLRNQALATNQHTDINTTCFVGSLIAVYTSSRPTDDLDAMITAGIITAKINGTSVVGFVIKDQEKYTKTERTSMEALSISLAVVPLALFLLVVIIRRFSRRMGSVDLKMRIKR